VVRSKENLFKTEQPGKNVEEYLKLEAEIAEVEAEERRLLSHVELPHLFGWKWYAWARAFVETPLKENLLCAANQISKSSTQIRKSIIWATDKDLWPSLWSQEPKQFWYLYPTQKQVNAEYETKWKLFLPKGSMKDDPVYGWKHIKGLRGDIVGLEFNSGIFIYFKTYQQNTQALQSGTCDAIFCDEELPIEHLDELRFRLTASNGYFHMVFTATLGQDFWRRAMDPGETEKEEFKDAFKQTISMYDCMEYEDGTPSHWTFERIKQIEASCSTQAEILKRVHGKFIVLSGRKYEAFDLKKHMKPKHPTPAGWLIYAGVDVGSGVGENKSSEENRSIRHRGHPSAICFVAVKPDFRQGRVIAAWRGDNLFTTAGDVFLKFKEMKKELKLDPVNQFYDWASKDFFLIAGRNNEPFEKAEKSHEIGEQTINTLFKHNMMFIYEDVETAKLGSELASLLRSTAKENAKDDLSDAFRYTVTKIPWDWTAITGAAVEEGPQDPEAQPMTHMQREVYERRKQMEDDNDKEKNRVEDELDEWNDAYGNNF
jgi:hypothetical protein